MPASWMGAPEHQMESPRQLGLPLNGLIPCIVDIEVPEGAKNLIPNLEIDEVKEDMLNEIRALEVRSVVLGRSA